MTFVDQQTLVGYRYQLLEKIGAGGMGNVFRALDRLNGERVALKQLILPPEALSKLDTDQQYNLKISLTREFQIAASLRHPNIVSVLDYGFDLRTRTPFLTMELLENAPDIVRGSMGLDAADRGWRVMQLLEGLGYLHRHGVIHHDLKANNVVVFKDRAKVLDFGLSIRRGEQGEVAGTLPYMAPELLKAGVATEYSDLYAAGVIAYQLFTGKYPFWRTVPDLLIEAIFHDPLDLSGFPPEMPELAKVIQRLLARDPAERYPSAWAARADLARAIGFEELADFESSKARESFLQSAPFVGRNNEFEQLVGALQNIVYHKKGSVWLVSGETGVGKTRLLNELRIRALTQDALVLTGQATSGSGQAYQVWRLPLRMLALSVTLTPIEAATLLPLIPEIADLSGITDIPILPALGVAETAANLSQVVGDLLVRASSIQPVVLILEDIHWSTHSLDLLKSVLPRVRDVPLMIIGSFREDEKPDLRERFPEVILLSLSRLSIEEVAELSEAFLGEGGRTPQLVDQLYEETEGNVFFLVEVVRALGESVGSLEEITRSKPMKRVYPGGVQAILTRRVSRLPAESIPLLQLAAAAGRILDLHLLLYLSDETRLEKALLTGSEALVLEIQEGAWRFAHEKLRELLLDKLSPHERQLQHLQIAAAIEQAYPNDPAYTASLSEQYWRANPTDEQDQERAARVSLAAGRAALAVGVGKEALLFAERGLNFSVDTSLRIELLEVAGDAHRLVSDYAKATFHYDHALELARRIGDTRAEVSILVRLGNVLGNLGVYNRAQEYYEGALTLYRTFDDARGIADCLHHLGTVADRRGAYELASELHTESLRISESLGELIGIGNACYGLGEVENALGRMESARDYFERSLTLRRQVGDRRGEARSLNTLGGVSLATGAYDEAKKRLEQALIIRGDTGDRKGLTQTLHMLGLVSRAQRDPDAARQYWLQAIELQRQITYTFGLVGTLNALAFLELETGNVNMARRYLREAFSAARGIGAKGPLIESMIGYARLYWLEGMLERAATLLGLALAHPAITNEAIEHRASPLQSEMATQIDAIQLVEWIHYGATLDFGDAISRILQDSATFFIPHTE
jgi:serine/threonine protein kinase/tetratricopeptide (TPR) repeat protein